MKKPKKLFILIGLVLALLGLDRYTFNWVSGGTTITVTDSSIIAAPIVDSVASASDSFPIAGSDTTKK